MVKDKKWYMVDDCVMSSGVCRYIKDVENHPTAKDELFQMIRNHTLSDFGLITLAAHTENFDNLYY